ncbi:mucin-21-like isoform X2 [Daphnia pulicaria]|uniref:mucin-21-like isoform X2 n=1 Tax=Daphnia pulicaria TaxID=35523 RepID=UPI001EEA44F3|nr:mucin-21-like isoform X2 [Daphnia pulicaria]
MSQQQISILLILIGSMSSAIASLNLHGQPLFSTVTTYTLEMATVTVNKSTPCYITEGQVTQCRRKRGMEERPLILQFDNDYYDAIAPSAVVKIESTAVPRSMSPMDIYRGNKLMANKVYSSFDDSFYNTQNNIRQLAIRGRNNVISVGNCGMSTVNFSEFLSCLGMTVQETTTLTATFTETSIRSTGYNTWTVMGCTPAGFPYQYCPSDSTPEVAGPIQSSTTDSIDTGSTTADPNATGLTTADPNATGSTTVDPNATGSTTADSIDTGSTNTADSIDTGSTTADSIDTGSTTADSSDAGSTTIDSTDIETTTDFVSTDTSSPTTTTEQIAP